MLSLRPGHLENATGHHHQSRGAPKTPGRQLKSGTLRENAHSVHRTGLGGKQTPFRGKTRKSDLPLHHHRPRIRLSKKHFTDLRVGLCSLLGIICGLML